MRTAINPDQIMQISTILGPVVQSIVSLTSLFTVLVSVISNSQIFLLNKKLHFFCKNISIYAIFNDQSFNNTLTNNIVSFEQLGPGLHCSHIP